MPDTAPDADLVAFLAANVAGLRVSTTLFLGPVQPSPAAGVFVGLSGSRNQGRYLGGSHDILDYSAQVIIREIEGRFTQGQAMARACRTALNFGTVTGYYIVFVIDAEPRYLGLDGSRRHRWSLDVLMKRVT